MEAKPSKGGRPSKYRAEYPEKLIAYFESYLNEPYTKEVIRRKTYWPKGHEEATVEEEYKLVCKPLPSLFDFARQIGVNYTTVYRWATDRIGTKEEGKTVDTRPFQYPEFCNAYKQRIQYQTHFLTHVGLSGIAPSPAFIFTAKNVIGWRDTQDQRFLDENGKAMAPSYVVLPRRMSEEEAAADYQKAFKELVTTKP